MKKLRKSDHCLNCGLHLAPLYHYCPQCGQENTDNKQSLAELLKDVYEDYITFDSRFWRSLKPFVIYPGLLTKEFNGGHRIRYVHPVRLYLLISLFYFFTFTHVFEIESIPTESLQVTEDGIGFNVGEKTLPKDSVLQAGADTLKKQLAAGVAVLADSQARKKTQRIINATHTKIDSLQRKVQKIDSTADEVTYKWQRFLIWIQNKKMKDTALLDSMGVAEKSTTTLTIARQLQKIGRNDLGIFLQSTIDNIPLMMIFLLPLMAVFLKLFYIRSKIYYIEHLVFAFHIQSFAYLALTIALLGLYAVDYQHKITIAQYTTGAITVYVLASFKQVYQQGFIKTFIKATMLSFTYLCVLLFFLIAELLLSFWLF